MPGQDDSKIPRRSFIKMTAAGAAAVGLVSAVPSAFAGGITGGTEQPQTQIPISAGPGLTGPLVAFVRDTSKGEITIMSGEREFVVNDPALVTRLTSPMAAG